MRIEIRLIQFVIVLILGKVSLDTYNNVSFLVELIISFSTDIGFGNTYVCIIGEISVGTPCDHFGAVRQCFSHSLVDAMSTQANSTGDLRFRIF